MVLWFKIEQLQGGHVVAPNPLQLLFLGVLLNNQENLRRS